MYTVYQVLSSELFLLKERKGKQGGDGEGKKKEKKGKIEGSKVFLWLPWSFKLADIKNIIVDGSN